MTAGSIEILDTEAGVSLHRLREVAAAPEGTRPPARVGSGVWERCLRLALLCAPAALLFRLAAQLLAADPDMFHEMALFREALATGWIPREDVFAYTPTVSPVIHHEWGTGALLYLAAVGAGWGSTGILMLRYLAMAGILAGCFAVARQRGSGTPVLALLAPVAVGLLAIGLSPVRAHLFSFVLLTCLLLFLEADRRGARWWVAAWLPLFVLWVNLHGGFVVGLGLFSLHALERVARTWGGKGTLAGALRSTRHLWLAVGAMLLLVAVNPYGWEYYPYLRHALLLERRAITEWAPLWDPGVHPVLQVLYGISLAFVLYAVLRGGVRGLPGLVLLLAAGYFALRHQRFLSLYAIVWLCYVPGFLSRTPFGEMIERAWRRAPVPLAALSLLCGAVWAVRFAEARPLELRIPAASSEAGPGTGRTGNGIEIVYPVGAVRYLAQHRFAGNLMTPFEVGAFVSWKLAPSVKIGLDGRYEVAYPLSVADEVFALYEGSPRWQETLERYGTDLVLVPRSGMLHTLLLRSTAGNGRRRWSLVYRDDAYSLFARPGLAASLPVADRSGEGIVGRFP